MAYSILAINTGSTSTKLALYLDKQKAVQKEYTHSKEELRTCKCMEEQLPMRRRLAEEFLSTEAAAFPKPDAVVARGGFLCPIRSGGYEINEKMVDYLLHRSQEEHASNLSACIAYGIAGRLGVKGYIYDGLSTDELPPVAKVTGIPDLPKASLCHMLNMRATALKAADALDKPYEACTFIVIHLGGGVSLSLHHQGQVIETVSDDEGPFSPERAGVIQGVRLLQYVENLPTLQDKIHLIRGGSGFVAYFGTSDAREVEKRIEAGDPQALLVYQALAYQMAKSVAALSSVTKGHVDAILFTGGVAYSKLMTAMLRERLEYLAPLMVFPGENEMESLANGAYRILTGAEAAKEFHVKL